MSADREAFERDHLGPSNPPHRFADGERKYVDPAIEREWFYWKAFWPLIARAAQDAKWISVEDRVPGAGETVIILDRGVVGVGHRANNDAESRVWHDAESVDADGEYRETYDVTRWMPLPDPPASISLAPQAAGARGNPAPHVFAILTAGGAVADLYRSRPEPAEVERLDRRHPEDAPHVVATMVVEASL